MSAPRVSVPQVSVIVPVRDDPVRLALCLEALDRQTLPRDAYEVIVVDNGSRPPVPDHPGAVRLREERVGSYAARNRGVAVAAAPVVAFTDADCLPEPDWLERALARLAADPGADAVAGEIEVFSARRPRAVEVYDRVTGFRQRHFVQRWGFGATANLVVRRRVLDAVGPFHPALRSGGDAEWGERATAAGFRIVYDESVRVRHPARRRVGELAAKLIRIEHGMEQLGRLRGTCQPLPRAVLARLAAPVRAAPLARELERPYDRLRFLAVSLLASLVSVSGLVRARRRAD